jgi:transaldolase/glucose-6-phosphate isomerase
VQRDAAHIDTLQHIRMAVRDKHKVATCAEFGPRFLHSTGQAYKGGPDTGVFLQITADDAEDLAIPDYRASFGVIKAAQARGDFGVLTDRNRRALRVHLKGDLKAGLAMLDKAIIAALN